jgi:hypothetical protein
LVLGYRLSNSAKGVGLIGDIGLKKVEQGLIKLGLVVDGKSASGLDKLFGFGEFLVVGPKDERESKGGGFDGIMESFSEGATDDGDATVSIGFCEVSDGIEDKNLGV